mmetsp:Transcript_7494/g.20989  ORF Transcript_7494/g.20989 Transcript_7494/m.20989 type:complete len:265 (+) Transcript_7494:1434-2228(+)
MPRHCHGLGPGVGARRGQDQEYSQRQVLGRRRAASQRCCLGAGRVRRVRQLAAVHAGRGRFPQARAQRQVRRRGWCCGPRGRSADPFVQLRGGRPVDGPDLGARGRLRDDDLRRGRRAQAARRLPPGVGGEWRGDPLAAGHGGRRRAGRRRVRELRQGGLLAVPRLQALGAAYQRLLPLRLQVQDRGRRPVAAGRDGERQGLRLHAADHGGRARGLRQPGRPRRELRGLGLGAQAGRGPLRQRRSERLLGVQRQETRGHPRCRL